MEQSHAIIPGYPIEQFCLSRSIQALQPDTRLRYQKCLMRLYDELSLPITRQALINWNQALMKRFSIPSVRCHVVAENQYFLWCNRLDLVQQAIDLPQSPSPKELQLTQNDYHRLLKTAKEIHDMRMYYLIKVFANVDLKVNCLAQLTYEVIVKGTEWIQTTSGRHLISIPMPLQAQLLDYCRDTGITCGPIFISRRGHPIDRASICRRLHQLCELAHLEQNVTYTELHKFFHKRMEAVAVCLLGYKMEVIGQLITEDDAWINRKNAESHPILDCQTEGADYDKQ